MIFPTCFTELPNFLDHLTTGLQNAFDAANHFVNSVDWGCVGNFTYGGMAGGFATGAAGGAAGVITGPGEAVIGPAAAIGGAAIGGATGLSMGMHSCMSSSGGTGGGGGETRKTSVNQMQQQVERGQAPKSVERVEKGVGPSEKDHIHFTDDSALNSDGTWKHGGRALTNKEAEWILSNGWRLPK